MGRTPSRVPTNALAEEQVLMQRNFDEREFRCKETEDQLVAIYTTSLNIQ